MKKFIMGLLAFIFLTGAVMAQSVNKSKKRFIITIPERASTMGEYVAVGDFVYIVADSALYCSRVALGPNATGTYLTASTSRYYVAKMATGTIALTATTGTFSSTLGVTGNVGIGTTAQNKFTVTGANGNTAIAGTLSVTGATSMSSTLGVVGNVGIGTSDVNKFTIAGTTGNTSISGTLGVTGNVGIGTTAQDKFTIAGTTGNTVVGGTFKSTGEATLSSTLVGTTAIRDTANFGTDASGSRNKYIRKKIIGVTAGDRFMVIPVMASTTATPGTAEFLGYYCTNDSLIISRNTASTAGLKVAFIRIK